MTNSSILAHAKEIFTSFCIPDPDRNFVSFIKNMREKVVRSY